MAAPSAMMAATRPQDSGRQEEHRRDDNDRSRFYDRDHRDYHNWNDKRRPLPSSVPGREAQRVTAVCGNEREGAKGVLEVASPSS